MSLHDFYSTINHNRVQIQNNSLKARLYDVYARVGEVSEITVVREANE